jgi:hypothetical protein
MEGFKLDKVLSLFIFYNDLIPGMGNRICGRPQYIAVPQIVEGCSGLLLKGYDGR